MILFFHRQRFYNPSGHTYIYIKFILLCTKIKKCFIVFQLKISSDVSSQRRKVLLANVLTLDRLNLEPELAGKYNSFVLTLRKHDRSQATCTYYVWTLIRLILSPNWYNGALLGQAGQPNMSTNYHMWDWDGNTHLQHALLYSHV